MIERLTAAGVMWAVGASLLGAGRVAAQDTNPRYTNLQVLPEDIADQELGQVMLANLAGLGLPRRAGEGCLYCHAGSLEEDRSTWDYASDEKPAKVKARVMMAMVREINEGHLSQLVDRSAPDLEVGCYTCHSGRTNPMPLSDLLLAEYGSGGVDALSRTYRAARARYYEADAYDFRVGTLIDVATQLVGRGALGDAAAVHELNLEYYDDPQAHGGLIQLRLFAALQTGGVEAMVERYEASKSEHPSTAFIASTLDGLAWMLFRSGEQDAGVRLFELNFTEHPTAFAANESMAYAASATGDHERGLRIARDWIAAHPDHEGGRQLLAELIRSGGG